MFKEALDVAANRISARLDEIFAGLDDQPVTRAMAYGSDGGKRLRGFLVLESARISGADPNAALDAACAIEMIHAYSLIHDDLPCMDDDDLRRGRPTVHRQWDEATAVLAGDGLHSMAFEVLGDPMVGPAEVRADLILTLAQAAGARGMVLGQALDIAAETAADPLTLDDIEALQAGKTGALFEWSASAGPRLVGAETAAMQTYAKAFGLAFQIADDILDIEGDAEKAGKRLRKDADAGKATFVSLLGLAAAKERASSLVNQALRALDDYGSEADGLRAAARFVIAREA